nr:unnamed protein product [Callosobruchus analis]
MALIGNIEPFSGVAEEFEVYLERMEHLFRVNCVDESLRVSMFVTLAGSKVYQTLKNLVAPTKPSELTYVQITGLLRKHYSPPVSEIYERFIFNKCNQEPDQSVADYIVELRKLASSCSFCEFLDDALRDRFVCGIRSEQLQRQLLSDDKLSFKIACQRAQAAELAEKQVKDLASSTDNPIYAVQRYPEKKYNKSPVTRVNSGMCKNCGRTHGKDQCPAARWKCFACGKYGHVRSRCLQKSSIGAVQEEHSVVVSSEESVSESVVVNEDLYSVQINNVSGMMPAHKVSLAVEGSHVDFEVDTGACKSLMSESMYHKFLGNVNLCKVRYRLNTISGENIKVVGEGMVQVKCKNKEVKLPLIIVESKNEFTPLLDILFRNWQHGFKVNTVNSLDKSVIVEAFSREYSLVFEKNLCDPMDPRSFEVKFNVKDEAKPVVRKAYDMPYALKPKVEKKIKQMVQVGILKAVNYSEWASPIVVVPKKDGDVRICADFRTTVNKALNVDQYPLPKPEDIFASLAGIFTVLDLSGAYQQLKVSPEYQKYLTVNTHLGMFQYTRLTYGISCAPALFQSVMDTILAGLPKVHCYLDDILISASNIEEMQINVRLVLARLNHYNVKVNIEKCKFFEQQV